MLGGYIGKILEIDLSKGKFSERNLDEKDASLFIGGRGLGANILYNELKEGTDPLGPDNVLIFSTGPFSGAGIPTSTRCVVTCKSPLTNIYLFSMAGGDFGSAIKRAGFDSIIIRGKSDLPVYLALDDGNVEIKDASGLWGMPTFETTRLIGESIGKNYCSASIGPAGENQVRISSIMTHDRRAFGRGGAGAVMGSKKIKAIAARGKKTTPIADHEKFKSAMRSTIKYLREHKIFGVGKRFSKTGTQDVIQINDFGILPTKNWMTGIFNKVGNISYPSLREKYVVKDTGCLGCPIKCTKVTLVREGQYAGSFSEGPEYETLYAMGSCCEIDNPEAIIAADRLCDDLGIDTMSMGVTLAFAMECYEKGLLSREEVDGIDLKFGNYEPILKLINKTAYKTDFGKLLSNGTKRLAEHVGKGSEYFAIHCKGLELGGYDPRGAKGQSLVYSVGSRGGCHHAMGVAARAEMAMGNPYEVSGKGSLVRNGAIQRIIYDSSMICSFPLWPLDLIAGMLSAITGLEMTKENIELIGDRIITTERMFNVREGITKNDDTLPERLLTEVLTEGPAAGKGLTKKELEFMKNEYYSVMGWDENGVPTNSCLNKLGLT